MSLEVTALTVDVDDLETVPAFWAAALGWRMRTDEDGDVWVEPGDGGAVPLLFLKVPEGKSTKNRLHLDLTPGDQELEVERLLDLGARRVDVGQSGSESWVVLADPGGNEFCVLAEDDGPDEDPAG